MVQEVDVAIVGSRVAGSVLATLLGEAGYHVIAVDAATFPSDTISTHFFRGAGLGSVLARLGLVDDVLALGAPPLTLQHDFSEGDPTPEISGPQDPGSLGYCLSVRRKALDQMLVARARAVAGVEILDATVARGVLSDNGRVSGIVIEHDGIVEDVNARLVVGADGRASAVARWVNAPIERREIATRAMYYRYFDGFPGLRGAPDAAEFSLAGDEMVYVFPSDSGITCVGLSINLATFRGFRSGPEARFEERIAEHAGIVDRYRSATPDGRLLGSGPRDSLIRTPWGPGWALVGDAAMNQDPWAGLGMDNAGIHATYLADAIDAWLSGRSSEVEAFAGYRERRDAHAMEGFDETVVYGRDLSALAAV